MYTPDQLKMMMDLFNNPFLKKGADEFYAHLQREGLESARKFWMNSSYANMFPDQQFMERLFDFYKNMGFVPLNQYEALQKENTKLKDENQKLNDQLSEIKSKQFAEDVAKTQETFKDVLDKQMEINREVTQGFFKALDQYQTKKTKK
jgi:regulator of replication initiation timing